MIFSRVVVPNLFGFLGLGIAVAAVITMSHYPITTFAINHVHWVRGWLIMSILNYYGAALGFSIIALHSEKYPYGLIWSFGFLVIGGPICCFYIVYRVLWKSVTLKDFDDFEVGFDEMEEENLINCEMVGYSKSHSS